MNQYLVHFSLVIAISLLLSACEKPSAEVNLYSARKEVLIRPLLEQFTQDTGITVNVISSKADALLKRIESEGINSPADVLLTTDAGRLFRAKSAGVFTPIASDVIESNVPKQYRDSENYWTGLSVRVRPIMVTEEGKKFNLSRYEDLSNPELSGQICIRSSSNIYNQSLVSSLLAASPTEEVETWAKGLVGNMARSPQGGDRDQIRAAAAGQCSIVVANTYYLASMISNEDKSDDFSAGSAMTVIWPNQVEGRGAHVNISGAGVVKSAPNKDNAVKLIEFLSSDKAQEIYANVNFEYPVKADIPLHPVLQKWGEFNADPLNVDYLGEKNADAVKLMDRAGWK
ncbi:Fe(3+) ABC transporter substrate-binding protein [Arenicella sp. 4NH20-0111]|uniref:extracellular solute-binding protein n=1 Tax=Arenicella sp. 4NH20-0111 TaxID=3127648 RepID=UPI00310B3E4E